ncbi:hypothetical protein BJX99DRAFT_258016 [Aspergillus californicus]
MEGKEIMTENPPRRYKSRRVLDENRKRAAQACDRCKARKSKCVGIDTGRCQRCIRDNRPCKLPTRRDTNVLDDTASFKPVENSVDINNSMKITWPKFLLQLREALALDSQTELTERDMMAMQTQYHQPTLLQPSEINRVQTASRALPPRPVADFLISVCMSHASDVFFYFDQARFLSEVHQIYTDSASPLRLDSGFMCLLLSTLALGSQWTDAERPLNFPNLRPDGADPGRVFYEEARRLIPDLMDRTSLTSIQAPFVLGVYSLPDRALGSAYAYMGLALRKAVALEIHQGDDLRFTEVERQVRCRLWWSVYSLERTTAIKLNRPRSIDPEVISTPLPAPLPLLDCLQKRDNVQYQIAYASLVTVLDRVADLKTETHDTPRMETLQQDLESWKRTLPPTLRIENLHTKDPGYRAVFHLQLNYLYAWILLGKGSLLKTIQAHVQHRPNIQTETESESLSFTPLAQSSIKASKMILDLCKTLANSNLIFRFSFTDFQGCSIATIVAILAGIIERDTEYESRVALGLNHLRTMALGNFPAEVGVRFVEDLQAISNEAFGKLGGSGSSTIVPGTERREEIRDAAGYSQWVQWVSRGLGEEMPTVDAQDTFVSLSTYQEDSENIPFPYDVLPRQSTLDADPQMTWSHDDQLALMGLTGLDMLEFEGFPSHPDINQY